MNCAEAQSLLHAYIDAELDVANSLEVERHLQRCEDCRRDYNDYQALHSALKGETLYFQVPDLLQKRIQKSLRSDEEIPASVQQPLKHVFSHVHATPWSWLAAAALLVFAFFGIWGITRFWSPINGQHSIAQQVVDSHVRSLMANHLIDVPFSNQHNIAPWFEGKLAYSPPVINLNAQGYTLIGGRMDFVDNQPVAAIVYKCGNHVINFFVWPTNPSNHTSDTAMALQGYNLVSWKAYNMNCWAVSDLNLTILHQFATLIDQHTDIAQGAGPSARGP
jgi:anti-sigma factor RsiW